MGTDFREEEREVALVGLGGGLFDVDGEQFVVFVRRGVGVDEFRAGVDEEFFEGRNAFLTVEMKLVSVALYGLWGMHRHPPLGHLGELLAVTLLDDIGDIVV